MFIIRGIARVVLDSKTVNISNEDFFNVFGSYIQIPGLDDSEFFMSALLFGILLSLGITIFLIVTKILRTKRGSNYISWGGVFLRVVIVDTLIITYCSMLAQYKGIPVMLLWILGVVVIFLFMVSQTVFGRHFYAVGGNALAAKLSGIDSRKVLFWAYLIMSIVCCFNMLPRPF